MKKVCFILAVLLAFAVPGEAPVRAETSREPALLSQYWTDGSEAAGKINEYIQAVTDEHSPDFIPVKDRIAVFDLDGTLMCETYPFCFEYMVFADYALNSGSDTITDAVRAVAQEIMDVAGAEKPSNTSIRQAAAGAIAYRGMTMKELAEMVRAFKESEAMGFSGLKRGDAYYKPMLELFDNLLENDFTVYVVTATERNIVREVIRGTLNIPPSHVIGTEYGYTATGQGETADPNYTFQPDDQIVFDGSYAGENAKTCKVDAIVREIGQQPVLAFGNSSGDLAMEIYTISNNPYRSAAYMVVADDAVREYGSADGAPDKKASYESMGIGVISMRDDFATIYGDGVEKTEIVQAVKEPAKEEVDVHDGVQYVLYVGTNDKDTNKPVFTQAEAMDMLIQHRPEADHCASFIGRIHFMGGKNEEINVFLRLVDRIEIRKNDGYDITIHWRTTAEQFLGRKKEESA